MRTVSKNSDRWLISPSHRYKIYWDIFIVALLTFVCLVIPFRVAFIKDDPTDES